jgi:hypothetical protein
MNSSINVLYPGSFSIRSVPKKLEGLDVAYHAVLYQLGLVDCEDGMTLMIARRIIDLATQGGRDPERLVAATVQAPSSSLSVLANYTSRGVCWRNWFAAWTPVDE